MPSSDSYFSCFFPSFLDHSPSSSFFFFLENPILPAFLTCFYLEKSTNNQNCIIFLPHTDPVLHICDEPYKIHTYLPFREILHLDGPEAPTS